ncbi:MAG TPA: Ig-like domain-containing protein [Solirubrobacteraceae bacterium]|jgi:hypothetical protein|nr:Ig-like domain-containing protein [Solirubrobacteraceae bacterium]
MNKSARLHGLAACLLLFCLLGSIAQAAPVTVSLRVEGATKTLFEGSIATEGESFETPSSKGSHPCDYSQNGNAGGFENEGTAAGTPTSALHDAAVATGLPFDAEWFGSGPEENGDPGDFFVSQVGPDVNETSTPFDSWGYAVNYLTAPVGGCQIALAPGSEVLWAYNYFNLGHRLKLTGPAVAAAGAPFTVKVTDGGTGAPVAGMTIGEMSAGVTSALPATATTNAAGEATVTLTRAGSPVLKAQGSGAVRSNGLSVCVHNGNDGTCSTVIQTGTSTPATIAPAADLARAAGVLTGHVYGRHSGPRVLRGVVSVPAGGTLRDVRISLERSAGKHCWVFSDKRARFVRASCSTRSFFSVGDALSFSYLLPTRLSPGRYVYDIETVDAGGHTTRTATGPSHVVFRVR